MLKKKKVIALTVCLCCFLFSVTVLAATREATGWNVYGSSGTVYANVGVGFTAIPTGKKGIVTYDAQIKGQDAETILSSNHATMTITGNVKGSVFGKFYYDCPLKGTKEFSNQNAYVTVTVTIDGKTESKQVRFN